MSSFIIDKIEYVKAAGLMYGYEEAKRSPHRYFLERVREEFMHCYALNVISVNEQYNDEQVPDENTYDEEFEAYRKFGGSIYTEGYTGSVIMEKGKEVMDKRRFRNSMFLFFCSVLYQIENECANRTVSAFFYTCLAKLYTDEIDSLDGWWGEIPIELED